MTDRDLPVTEDELHVYVDGELAADRREAVERWLASHPDDAARFAAAEKAFGGWPRGVVPEPTYPEPPAPTRRPSRRAIFSSAIASLNSLLSLRSSASSTS